MKIKIIAVLIAILLIPAVAGAVSVNWGPYQEIAPVESEGGNTIIETDPPMDADYIDFSDTNLAANNIDWLDIQWSSEFVIDADSLKNIIIKTGGEEYKIEPFIVRFLWWKFMFWRIK